jgi:hypothetical protein
MHKKIIVFMIYFKIFRISNKVNKYYLPLLILENVYPFLIKGYLIKLSTAHFFKLSIKFLL